jgi:hypothetical protein
LRQALRVLREVSVDGPAAFIILKLCLGERFVFVGRQLTVTESSGLLDDEIRPESLRQQRLTLLLQLRVFRQKVYDRREGVFAEAERSPIFIWAYAIKPTVP